MNSEFMAFITDEASVTTMRVWAERQGFPVDSVKTGGADLFATLLESDAPPKLAFVDIDNLAQPDQSASRLVSLCGSGTKIIALGSANDVSVYRGLLTAGMTDYLVKPLTPESLMQALVLATRGRGASEGSKETKIVILLGLRGGVGVSTIATNISWLIAHEMKQKCILMDLDLQFGTSALSLDIEPGHGFREVVNSPQRVDSLMVSGATVNESDMFSVLSAEEALDEIVHVDNSAVSMLLKELRMNYRVIIVDMPRHLIPTQKRLFALAHDIVMVTDMSLAGIRDTLRVRTALKALGVTARMTLVATRVGPQRSGAVDEATFTKGAQTKIDFFLPDDPKNVIAASNAGKMLGALAKNAPLTKSLLQLAKHLAGATDKKEDRAKGGWLGLFGGRKTATDGAS
jgi:pilus assembly protein CpaE